MGQIDRNALFLSHAPKRKLFNYKNNEILVKINEKKSVLEMRTQNETTTIIPFLNNVNGLVFKNEHQDEINCINCKIIPNNNIQMKKVVSDFYENYVYQIFEFMNT